MSEKPRWGIFDLILIYAVITLVSLGATWAARDWWSNPIQLFLFSFVVQFLATIAAIFVLVVLILKTPWSELGIRITSRKNIWTYGIGGGFSLIVIVMVGGYVLKYFQPELAPQPIEEILRAAVGTVEFLMLVVFAVILAPIGEEIFYRGMIYPVCRWHLGPRWGAVVAGLVFGLAHWDFWRSIPLAVGGMALCYLYEKSGSIFVSMTAHGIWNAVMCGLIYLTYYLGG